MNPESTAPGTDNAAPAPDQDTFVLHRSTLAEDIRRWQSADSDFSNTFGDQAGRYAQRTWEPKVKALESQLAEERKLRRKLEIESMPAEEIDKRFAADPAFAAEVAELVHFKPTSQAPQVEFDERPRISAALTDLMQWARDEGLPEDRLLVIGQKAAEGKYGTDPDWTVNFGRMQRDVTRELVNLHRQQPEPPTRVVNSKLANGGPDTSPPQRGGRSGLNLPATTREFNMLSQDQQKALYEADPEGVVNLK